MFTSPWFPENEINKDRDWQVMEKLRSFRYALLSCLTLGVLIQAQDQSGLNFQFSFHFEILLITPLSILSNFF